VTKGPLGVAVSEDKQIDEGSDRRKPNAAWSTGDQPLAAVENAANPEKLAGDKDQEYG
jgi:hypothetical protein